MPRSVDDEIKRAITEELSVKVPIAGRALGLSRNSAYLAVRTGELPSVKIGKRYAVPTAPLRRLLGL